MDDLDDLIFGSDGAALSMFGGSLVYLCTYLQLKGGNSDSGEVSRARVLGR